MIGAINPNLVSQRAACFHEGANTNNGKITAVALSILGALASFVFLPVEGALMASLGIGALLSMVCCCPSSGGSGTVYREQRWYHPFFNAIPAFFRSGGPAVVPGVHLGAPFSGGVPNGVVQGQPVHNVGNRAEVNRGHRTSPFNGVQVLPPLNHVQPVVHFSQQGGPAIGPNTGHHVPAGHGHR